MKMCDFTRVKRGFLSPLIQELLETKPEEQLFPTKLAIGVKKSKPNTMLFWKNFKISSAKKSQDANGRSLNLCPNSLKREIPTNVDLITTK